MKINKKWVIGTSLTFLLVGVIFSAFVVAQSMFPQTNWIDNDRKRVYGSEERWGSGMVVGAKTSFMRKGFLGHPRWNQSRSENLTIDSAKAKAVVEAATSNLKVGAITSFNTNWIIPIEDEKGVVALIQVSKVSASTAEKAKSIVEESLKKGWKAGEPRLMRTIYSVPLLDSNGATIGYVRVDGKSGEIIRRPTTMLAITSDQAKAIVSDAVMEFVIGGAKERGSLWMVSIKYKDKVVMVLLLGKLNTPTSEDAIKAVQESLRKGWSTGEPRQLRFIYNVPIIDANNNTIGTIKVDGRTGEIIIGIPMPLL